MKANPSRFAAFDIDGTLFRWQLYHELFDELCRRDVIDTSTAQPILDARGTWQTRLIEFTDYEDLLVEAMEEIMDGLSESTLHEAADHILQSSGQRIYRYTISLLNELKGKGYTIIAISGSHQQLAEKFASQFPIDIVYGRQFTALNGKIIGHPANVYGNKAPILQQLVADHNLTWNESYAIGDTNSDGDMMDLVAHPVAFNPDKRLYDRARTRGWPIVIERKNVIYELRPDGTTHVLA